MIKVAKLFAKYHIINKQLRNERKRNSSYKKYQNELLKGMILRARSTPKKPPTRSCSN